MHRGWCWLRWGKKMMVTMVTAVSVFKKAMVVMMEIMKMVVEIEWTVYIMK